MVKVLKNQKGQTSVEYILMMVVIVAVFTGIFKKIEGYLITDPNSFKNTYLGRYEKALSGGRYEYFNILR